MKRRVYKCWLKARPREGGERELQRTERELEEYEEQSLKERVEGESKENERGGRIEEERERSCKGERRPSRSMRHREYSGRRQQLEQMELARGES